MEQLFPGIKIPRLQFQNGIRRRVRRSRKLIYLLSFLPIYLVSAFKRIYQYIYIYIYDVQYS